MKLFTFFALFAFSSALFADIGMKQEIACLHALRSSFPVTQEYAKEPVMLWGEDQKELYLITDNNIQRADLSSFNIKDVNVRNNTYYSLTLKEGNKDQVFVYAGSFMGFDEEKDHYGIGLRRLERVLADGAPNYRGWGEEFKKGLVPIKGQGQLVTDVSDESRQFVEETIRKKIERMVPYLEARKDNKLEIKHYEEIVKLESTYFRSTGTENKKQLEYLKQPDTIKKHNQEISKWVRQINEKCGSLKKYSAELKNLYKFTMEDGTTEENKPRTQKK